MYFSSVMMQIYSRIKSSEFWQRESRPSSALGVIGWWEVRRIPFKLIVGSAGIITCIIIFTVAVAASTFFDSGFGGPDPPVFAIFGILLYAIMANVCYTGGWICELIVRAIWPDQSDRFAKFTFKSGMVFSVLLTLSPGFLVGVVGLFMLVRRLMNGLHG